MKKIYCIIAVITFSLSINAQDLNSLYAENELIIWLKQGVDAEKFAASLPYDIVPKSILSKRLNIWLFEFTHETAMQRSVFIDKIHSNSDVKHVQNNHYVVPRSIYPNDPLFSMQWALEKIHLPEAWDEFTTGGLSKDGDTIVIAIVDFGFYLSHEDINFWKNTHEIPNNGIDDDNNGYIDDFDGWNASYHSGSISSASSHGTNVAGVAGAIGNNNKGISGVNWNVGILPVMIYTESEAAVVEAYSYILDMRTLYNETNGQSGAFIVVTNSSFGRDEANPADFPIWCEMYNELGNAGILSCAATTNYNNMNIDTDGDVPTACSSDFLVAVTATTPDDTKHEGVGFGLINIDIGAPGTSIYSTFPYNEYDNIFSGTSYASPQVAGVIALMYAAMSQKMLQNYKNNPANVALWVKQCLLDGADKFTGLNVVSGRLNAYNAVKLVMPISIDNQEIVDNQEIKICQDVEISNTSIEPNANVVVTSGTQIRLLPGFHAKAGSNFHAYIEPCASSSAAPAFAPSNRNNTEEQETEQTPSNINAALSENKISIYPNPANDKLIIDNAQLIMKNTAGNADVQIIDITGRIIFNSPFTTHNSIDVSGLSSSIYLLKVQTDKGAVTQKFIKK